MIEEKEIPELVKMPEAPVANRPAALNTENEEDKKSPWRANVAYWLLGLCNNYGYVVMLTAAGDIIEEHDEKTNPVRGCKYMSTGAILLADIVPCLLIKITTPFLPFFVRIRVVICMVLAILGFLLVAFSGSITLSLIGVVVTSISSGLGEVTYLQYCSFYHKNTVSAWSSGTGGAGIFGATSYALLASLGIQISLVMMISIPILMGIAFFIILPKPDETSLNPSDSVVLADVNREEIENPLLALKKKFQQIPSLFKYMIPVGTVYLFEYFINQGTFELINFEGIFLDKGQQYRWLQVDYQIGVFISRSSVNIVHIRQVWIMSILQAVNVVIFTTHVIYFYIPSFWIVIGLTFWEGLLGGAAYVNTFYRLQAETPDDKRQFAMSITSFADATGISISGVIAIYAHNAICNLPLP